MTLDFNGGNWNMENDKVKSLIDMMKINFYNFVEIYFCLCQNNIKVRLNFYISKNYKLKRRLYERNRGNKRNKRGTGNKA